MRTPRCDATLGNQDRARLQFRFEIESRMKNVSAWNWLDKVAPCGRTETNSGAAGGRLARVKFPDPAPKNWLDFGMPGCVVLARVVGKAAPDHSPTQRGVNIEALRLSSCERLTAFRPASWRRHPSIHRAMCSGRFLYAHSARDMMARSSL